MSNLYKKSANFGSSVPDIGEVFYAVDTNYRTGVQGWSQADRTGPLDLYNEKNPGRVFYGAGGGTFAPSNTYATDAAALQAAIDAMVDFRGDTLFMTPGNYSLATALNLNVSGMRWKGKAVANPRRAAVTITDAIGDHSFAAAGDDNEVAFLRFVPLTAQNTFTNVSGSDGNYFHHIFWDAKGVATSTATECFNLITSTSDWLVEDSVFEVDAAQGDAFTLSDARRLTVDRCQFSVVGPTITWASLFTFATTASLGCIVKNCDFGSGGGANGLITNVFTGMAGGSILLVRNCYLNGTSTPTATNIETGFDATVGIELAENYITGDATTQGGLLIVLA